MPSPRFPIPQGTLDMLILQILSLEPAHGYGSPSGWSRSRARSSRSTRARFIPPFTDYSRKAGCAPSGNSRRPGRRPSSTSLTAAGRRLPFCCSR